MSSLSRSAVVNDEDREVDADMATDVAFMVGDLRLVGGG
jgi:hypothetical protein